MAWLVPIPPSCALVLDASLRSERRDEKKLPHGWQHGEDSKSWNSRSQSMDPNSFSGISFFGLSDFLFCFRYISYTLMLSHAFVPLHMPFPLYGMILLFSLICKSQLESWQ